MRDAPGPKLKNYITPAGLQRLKDEHRFLLNRERPAVTGVVAWAARTVPHQREVGAGYFDLVSQVVAGGITSTLALEGSTEEEQF